LAPEHNLAPCFKTDRYKDTQVLIGYARCSKADGSQVLDLQMDALKAAGVREEDTYTDMASGRRDDRPGLTAALKALRPGDCLVAYKLDRIGRSLLHLISTVNDLEKRGISLKVLTGAQVDTSTPAGKLMLAVFASLSAFEADLTRERTMAGLAAARARGRVGGRPPKMSPAKVRLAQAAMGKPETRVGVLCKELGISRQTLYRFVAPDGSLRSDGQKVLKV